MEEQRDFEKKYQRIILWILLGILLIIAFLVGYFVLSPAISRFSADFYYPVFKVKNMAKESIVDKALLSKSKRELVAAITILQRNYEELSAEAATLRQYREEYAALLKLAKMQPPEEFNYTIADVLLRNPASWLQVFTVDKGTSDGVHMGDLVVATVEKDGELYSAAVGRIGDLSNHTAVVLTLYHPDCSIGAYLKGADAYGLLNGMQRETQAQDGATIRVSGLSAEKQYKTGDVFLTSHFSKSFPADIELGTLVSSYVDADGLCRTAEMLPSVNFANIRSVAILSRKE